MRRFEGEALEILTRDEHAAVASDVAAQLWILVHLARMEEKSASIIDRIVAVARPTPVEVAAPVVNHAMDACAMLLTWLSDTRQRCYPNIDDVLREIGAVLSSVDNSQRRHVEPLAAAAYKVASAALRAQMMSLSSRVTVPLLAVGE